MVKDDVSDCSAARLAKARRLGARLAREWWDASPDRSVGICDRCNRDIPRGEGYLCPQGSLGSADLLCRWCFRADCFTDIDIESQETAKERQRSEAKGSLFLGVPICASLAIVWSPWWWIGAGLAATFGIVALVHARRGSSAGDGSGAWFHTE